MVEINENHILYSNEDNEYPNLGQLVSFQTQREKDVLRRTEVAWRSYWFQKYLMKGDSDVT